MWAKTGKNRQNLQVFDQNPHIFPNSDMRLMDLERSSNPETDLSLS